MGWRLPPAYGIKEVIDIVDKISSLDEQINELAIEREVYVKALKEQVEEVNASETEN